MFLKLNTSEGQENDDEDSYGNACECEGNFDSDDNVAAGDLALFKSDYG